MIFDEAHIVVVRINGDMASEAVLIQMAIATVMDKRAGKRFEKEVKRLAGGA